MPQTNEETMEQWREMCRWSMRQPLQRRLRNSAVVVKGAERVNRSFATMAEYRAWCERNLPRYLGYGRTLGIQHQPPSRG
jgi:hypothetical protein